MVKRSLGPIRARDAGRDTGRDTDTRRVMPSLVRDPRPWQVPRIVVF